MNGHFLKVNVIFNFTIYFCFFSVSNDIQESNTLGFFESIEQEKAQAEMAKMLAKKKLYPIAPDGKISQSSSYLTLIYLLALIPNSTIRSLFKRKDVEPVEVKLFRLRLVCN